MCGIAGIFVSDGAQVDGTPVETMLDTLEHRGPDSRSVWQDTSVVLGHCRLTILDPTELAAQPMATPDGKGVVAYNGEVYNFRELRLELKAEGVSFRSESDTEVVLHALHLWGPERAIPLFNGMFSIAYFDMRSRTLWLARDRLGIKPLVTMRFDNKLVFASEVKALRAHPQCVPRLSPEKLLQWLAEPRQQPHSLLLDGVEDVAPGSWWRINSDGVASETYYKLPEAVDPERISRAARSGTFGLVDRFEGLLDASVRAHLVSDVPVAAMCSGGVDSSLITALASKYNQGIVGYVADIPSTGEAEAAETVGRHLGVDIKRVPLERKQFLKLWPLAVQHSDGPLFHASDIALLAVAQQCRQDEVKVLLTGEGSDEFFGGYEWHRATLRQWRKVEGLRALLTKPSRRRMKQAALDRTPFRPAWGWTADSRVLLTMGVETSLSPPDLMSYLSAIMPASERAVMAHCLHETRMHLPWLLHRHDRMGMAASIEMRVPFIENDLIDFAFHLPPGARIKGRQGKWVVKEAAARHLPRHVVYAKKKGFPVPATLWRGCERILLDGMLAKQFGWTDEAVGRIITRLAGNDLLGFHLVGLELWLRLSSGEEPDGLGQELLQLADTR